jgi:hypothetical protein
MKRKPTVKQMHTITIEITAPRIDVNTPSSNMFAVRPLMLLRLRLILRLLPRLLLRLRLLLLLRPGYSCSWVDAELITDHKLLYLHLLFICGKDVQDRHH